MKKEAKASQTAATAGAPSAGTSNGREIRRALLVIDVQKDFGSRGELPVPDAEAIVPLINKLMLEFGVVVATQDWHPKNHISFASRHGKKPGDCQRVGSISQPLFPDHCVQGTSGAEFIDGLDTKRFDRVFRKGTNVDVDSFSAFVDNAGGKATDIGDFLRERGVDEVFVCGLATNYCVMRTALDALAAGFKVNIILDACRGIDQPAGAVDAALAEMRSKGVNICQSADLNSDSKATTRSR